MCHITGGGLLNFTRLSDFGIAITDPLPPQQVFTWLQETGGVSDGVMRAVYRAAETRIPKGVIDLTSVFADERDPVFTDDIHTNEAGARRIAEALFSTLTFDRLLLEYDTERAGGFEPLRFVPRGRAAPVVVLGLITTKTGEVESVDALARRIEDAQRFIPLDQLALSPQCGFASGIAGNLLGEDAQWRKLEVILETARRVWR